MRQKHQLIVEGGESAGSIEPTDDSHADKGRTNVDLQRTRHASQQHIENANVGGAAVE